MSNPFYFNGAASGRKTINRSEDISLIRTSLEQRRNILIYGPRRSGKTTLAQLALEEPGNPRPHIWLNLSPCRDSYTLTQQCVSQLCEFFKTDADLPINSLQILFPSLAPHLYLSADASGSRPRVALRPNTDAWEPVINDIFDHLDTFLTPKKLRLTIVLDECQHLRLFPEPGRSALSATFTQERTSISWLLTTSQSGIPEEWAPDPGNPWRRSIRELLLASPPRSQAHDYIRERFSGTGKSITDEALELMSELTEGKPRYLQALAHAAWNFAVPNFAVCPDDMQHAMKTILKRSRAEYENLWENLSADETSVLTALARLQTSSDSSFPTGGFLESCNLTDMESLRIVLKNLETRGVLHFVPAFQQGTAVPDFSDPFLKRRLREAG